MISFLARMFIKDYKNTSSPQVRQAYGMLCGSVGIGLNILLFIGKFFAGILSGSIAITADAVNNLSDAGSSFITLIGFKMAEQTPAQSLGRRTVTAGVFPAAFVGFAGGGNGGLMFDTFGRVGDTQFFGKGVYFLPKSIAVERIGHFGIDGCSAIFGAARFQFFGYGEVVHGYLNF